MARAVDGVEEALRLGPTLVFNASREGREDVGVGECARDEAIDGRGEDRVDMVAFAERMKRDARGQVNVKRWSVPCWSSELLPSLHSFHKQIQIQIQ
jgi:hypothetical protein